jgi:hypothetical protein
MQPVAPHKGSAPNPLSIIAKKIKNVKRRLPAPAPVKRRKIAGRFNRGPAGPRAAHNTRYAHGASGHTGLRPRRIPKILCATRLAARRNR